MIKRLLQRTGLMAIHFTLTYGIILFITASFFSQTACTRKTSTDDNTIHAVLSNNVKGLDPVVASDTYVNAVASQIYESLLHYHYLKRPLELQPLLAQDMPEVSEDGLTHTFKIKPGVRFHDNPAFPEGKGREITAHDFIYSWKRLADPANQSDGFWIFDGKIVGFNEWQELKKTGKADYDTPIQGLQAPDDHTLIIQLTRPYYQLHYVLTMTYAAVVPREAVEKYGPEFLNNPVGTGPFRFDNWIRNSRITLAKNPTWHGGTYPTEGEPGDKEAGLLKDAGKPLPFADRVVFHEIIEDQPMWLNFMRGNLDMSTIPKDNFDSAIKDGQLNENMQSRNVQLYYAADPDVTYIAFNMEDPLLGKNKYLRQAISLAYDGNTIIERFYNGRAIPAHSPIPPSIDAYDPDFTNPYREYNLEKAKELLVKAGFPEGKGLPRLEYSTVSSTTARQMAEFFQQNMAQLGIRVSISPTAWPQFTQKLRDRRAQIWGIAWLADYPDAENFLQLLYGENASPGPNASNYNNAKFNELYQQASKLPPGPERTRLYHQMRDIIVEDAPWVPGVHRLGYYVYHGWLKNFKRHSIVSDYFKYLRVDPEERATGKAKL